VSSNEVCEHSVMMCENNSKFKSCVWGKWYEQSCAPGTQCKQISKDSIECS
jgi:hypothetical protein